MGNQKFRLSDMIPNAWFYKLRDMNKNSKVTPSKPKKHSLPPPPAPPSSPPTSTAKTPPQPEPQCHSRKSYHITRELSNELPKGLDTLLLLHSPPRKSKSSIKSRKSTNRRSSSNSTCSCRTSSSSTLSHRSKSRSPHSPSTHSFIETDVLVKEINKDVGFLVDDVLLQVKQSIIDNNAPLKPAEHYVDKESLTRNHKINNFKLELPPIITKQETITKPKNNTIKLEKPQNPPILKDQRHSPPSRRFSVSSPGGIRLTINSPRIMGKKQGQNGNYNGGRKSTSSKKRRSITESFAVVKSSRDPQRDFRESMVEMIVQNNLRGSKDLEDLLACYLSLNSDEYHEVIIKVFKQLWFDLRQRK